MRKKRPWSQGQRKPFVLKRDGYTCQYCGYSSMVFDEVRSLVMDHIIPVNAGGDYSYENLITSCSLCNSLAAGSNFDSLDEKSAYIIAQLRRRGAGVYWADSTLEEIYVNIVKMKNGK